MNPKIFAKVFNDIKKQAENEQKKPQKSTPPSIQPPQSPQLPQSSQLNPNPNLSPPTPQTASTQPNNPAKQPQASQQIKAKVLDKKIAKPGVHGKEDIIKAWKEKLYKKIGEAKLREIVVEGSNSKQILGIVKDYRIDIEEIYDDKLILNSQEKANQCLQLLQKSGITCRKANQPPTSSSTLSSTPSSDSNYKQSSIFKRLQ